MQNLFLDGEVRRSGHGHAGGVSIATLVSRSFGSRHTPWLDSGAALLSSGLCNLVGGSAEV